jgi:hypothetical protein
MNFYLSSMESYVLHLGLVLFSVLFFRSQFVGPSPSFFFPLDFFCHWQGAAMHAKVFLLTSQRPSVRFAQ